MAVYFVTGKLGSGKTLAMVGRIKDYLLQGRRVATNLDLNLDELLASWRRVDVVRVPDRPTADDLELLGRGDAESYDESKFGALVFDECALSLNTRTWSADKSRQGFINWLVHARKKGWDVFFIVQDLDAIDKQVRDMFCEHLVVCERLDRMSLSLFKAVPFVLFFAFGIGMAVSFKAAIGFLVMLFCLIVPLGRRVPLPKIHRAKVYYGDSTTSPNVDTWIYTAKDLYPCYDTRQKYFDRDSPLAKGLSSMLTPWHLKGRYENAKQPTSDKFRGVALYVFNSFFLIVGVSVGVWSFSGDANFSGTFARFTGKTQTNIHKQESTDLHTKTVDNFGVRISGSFAMSDGTFKYFFERDDLPVDASTWIVRPYGPCKAQVEHDGQTHLVECSYAKSGEAVASGSDTQIASADAVGAITDLSLDILP